MKLVLRSLACAMVIFSAGCAATVTVDGYEARYVDAPVEYHRYPRYEYRGATVYEIDGRYYREYNRRWVVYHERPRELRRYP